VIKTEKGGRLNPMTVKYLEAPLKEPLIFWHVEAVEVRRGILAKNLLLVLERFIEDMVSLKM
jgi:hypothetical protein